MFIVSLMFCYILIKLLNHIFFIISFSFFPRVFLFIFQKHCVFTVDIISEYLYSWFISFFSKCKFALKKKQKKTIKQTNAVSLRSPGFPTFSSNIICQENIFSSPNIVWSKSSKIIKKFISGLCDCCKGGISVV